MVVLVLAASMSIGWAAVLAGIVFAQKVLPLGETWARITGAALLFAASVTLVS